MTSNGVIANGKPHPEDPPPILSKDQVLDALSGNTKHKNTHTYRAFYSSVVGGITRDPSLMVAPLDDHMVHRGHAVFDTAIIHKGQLYELEEHLDRFQSSISSARIKPHFTRDFIRNIIVSTASASGLEEGYMRYWMSAGIGGFSVSPSECVVPSLYVLAIGEPCVVAMGKGVKMITAKTAMKSPLMATTKTVNYLPNALVQMEAEEAGVFTALWIDETKHIAEGPCMNVAFVSSDGYLLIPPCDRILAGCTMNRVKAIAESLVQSGGATSEPVIKGVRYSPVPESAAREASEMFLVGSGVQVLPVLEWDGKSVGEGRPGPVAGALHSLLLKTYTTVSLTPIPKTYG